MSLLVVSVFFCGPSVLVAFASSLSLQAFKRPHWRHMLESAASCRCQVFFTAQPCEVLQEDSVTRDHPTRGTMQHCSCSMLFK